MKRKLEGLTQEIGDLYMRHLRDVSSSAYDGKLTGSFDLENEIVELVVPVTLGRSEAVLDIVMDRVRRSYPGLKHKEETDLYRDIDKALK